MIGRMNIGLIGAGNRSIDLLKAVNAVEGMRVTAVADPCRDSMDRSLKELAYTPDRYRDYTELLAREDVDGVLIVTPNDTHIDIATKALESRKAVYLEKPMGINPDKCAEFIRFARQCGGKVMIGMQLRYSDVYRKMKAICDDATIGDVKLIMYRALRNRFRPGVDNWRLEKKRSGGTILEVSVHQLDLFNWFAGAPVSRVAAFAGRDAIYQEDELYDNVMMIAQYENGVKASLQAAVFAPQGGDATGLCIVGTRGTIYETNREIVIKLNNDAKDEIRLASTGFDDMDRSALEDFMQLAINNRKPLMCMEDGMAAVELAILAERYILKNS